MSKATKLFPLISFLVGTTRMLAVDLYFLCGPFDCSAKELLPSSSPYFMNEDHHRQEMETDLISPVAALSMIQNYQPQNDVECEIQAEIVAYLEPIAACSPNGFKVPEPAKFTRSVVCPPEFKESFDRLEGEIVPLFNALPDKTDLSSFMEDAEQQPGPKKGLGRMASFQPAQSQQQALQDAESKVNFGLYNLCQSTLVVDRLETAARRSEDESLFERVGLLARKDAELKLVELKKAQANLEAIKRLAVEANKAGASSQPAAA